MTEPEVSVVCSTYQRASRVLSLLAALEEQTFGLDRFEVVIVDNGSTDDTAQVLAEFARGTKLDLRPVTLPTNRGASGGRNAGWRAARAPIVAFTDDDCVPDPDWLRAGMETLRASDAAIVVGRTMPNPAHAANSGVFSRTQTVNERNATTYFNTCNIFYRREDLEAVGGFDAEFRNKGGEDTDLGWCVEALGGAAVFAQDALVLHDINRGSFKSALREAYTWVDIPRVTAKHPRRARPLLVHRVFWKASHEYVLVALASLVTGVLFRKPWMVIGVAPWIYYRVRKKPLARKSTVQRFTYLPHAFAIDAVELATMARGSVRNRTLVL